VFVDFLDKWGDGFGFGIQLIETTEVGDEFDELVVNFSLILRFFIFLGDLSI
jgi:hypothetical protein